MESLHLECGLCRQANGGGMVVSRRQSEIEFRSRPRGGLQPQSPAMALHGLLAEGEPKSVPGVFFAVQALKPPEYAALECRFNTRTVILHGECPIGIQPSG